MSEPKSKNLRARATRFFHKRFGSPSSTASPSQPSTPNLPSVLLSPPASGIPETRSQTPLPSSCLPVLGVPEPSSPASIGGALLPPVSVSQTPSLHVPAALQDLTSGGNEASSWSGLCFALQTLHANSAPFPPLQSVIGDLLSGFELFEEPTRNQKECETLALELKMMSETLDRHLQGSNTVPNLDSIVKIVQSIQGQVDLIAKEQNHSLGRHFMKAEQITEALSSCDRLIQVLCRQLQLDAGLGSRNQLKDLNPARLAAYDSSLAMDINRRACTENTRVGVLSDIHTWLVDPNAPNVCWLNGMAGTGKTTIAYTLARELEKSKQLAASFFCTRTAAECRDVSRIISTIAYQIARRCAPFLRSLCRVLYDDPDIFSSSIANRFERILKQPLLEVKDKLPSGLVIIIDALDECTASHGVKLVLDILLREAQNLPLKFFVTSRPEPSIRSKIQEQPESLRSVYELHAVKLSDVQADIELYLQEELPSVAPPRLKQLAKQSGGLFIYAATAARYIRAGNIEERLTRILSAKLESKKVHAEIDELYTSILSAAFTNLLEDSEEERMKLVLRTAVCVREPISVCTLATLTNIAESNVLEALEPLRSVIYVSDGYDVVSTLHASFPDYMLNQSRSSTFYCDQGQHDRLLAQRCFELMKQLLRFNICGLESSYLPDELVPSLESDINKAITPALAYACRYWADHLRQTNYSDDMHALLADFVSKRLLFWMEVMNLKHWIGIGARVMLTAKLWIMTQNIHSDLLQGLEDARNFVTSFAANAVARSTPHIYVSALSFCHQSSVVYKHYWNKAQGMIKPEGPGITSRYQTAIASWRVGSCALSVAYSPDGTRIAIGCDDGSIIIKDVHDGAVIGTPLRGHLRSVRSLAFSPDGARIVSGSGDETLRLWNAQDGSQIGAPLEGHTDWIKSVAFSPDSTRIVSGSGDGSIRVWNAHDGSLVCIGVPLEDSPGSAKSVVFSPDGSRIISGFSDHAVRMWDAQNGSPIGGRLRGHANEVNSVTFSSDTTHIIAVSRDNIVRRWNAQDGSPVGVPIKGPTGWADLIVFSPDGTRIASGFSDNTIRIWGAQDGIPIGAPLQGHTKSITSIAFSSDSTCIVSGSFDKTTRTWNAQGGSPINAPPQGHTDWVRSVAFSPDGTRIVSGSDDRTIRIWSARDGSSLSTPLKGHTKPINSVAFSPNCAQIVSASGSTFSHSHDNTIRIWDTRDGSPIGVPLQGHTNSIKSVAFSPDGTRIVSGSADRTIRIWNSQDGSPIGAPLEGHKSSVNTVAFSHDSMHIISGSGDISPDSSDNSVRVWNACDGSLIGVPLVGHTDWVNSVASSPDGTRIISGSADKTIRIWNFQDNSPIAAPLEGHTNSVNSVAFSPDSTRIVSGSSDMTIRVWGAQDGSLIGIPLLGHTRSINSVAFSPDGTCILSASNDKTIRAWIIQDGDPIDVSLESHTNFGNSVALLPNSIHVNSGLCDETVGVFGPDENTPLLGPNSADTWSLREDGWMLGPSSRLLLWVPQDLIPVLPMPYNPWVIRPNGTIRIDYSHVLNNRSWYNYFSY